MEQPDAISGQPRPHTRRNVALTHFHSQQGPRAPPRSSSTAEPRRPTPQPAHPVAAAEPGIASGPVTLPAGLTAYHDRYGAAPATTSRSRQARSTPPTLPARCTDRARSSSSHASHQNPERSTRHPAHTTPRRPQPGSTSSTPICRRPRTGAQPPPALITDPPHPTTHHTARRFTRPRSQGTECRSAGQERAARDPDTRSDRDARRAALARGRAKERWSRRIERLPPTADHGQGNLQT